MDSIISGLKVKLFADGADLPGMLEMATKPFISGFTTNPTLMRKAGINDYATFAKSVLKEIKDKPISFEVFSDDVEEMKIQGEKIASWGENVFVKIPITNARGESTLSTIKHLNEQNVKLNVTALMTVEQVKEVAGALNSENPSFVSVFAGRIADTGRDPVPIMTECLKILSDTASTELIWASPRELLNIIQADEIGCQIITATNDILSKLPLLGKDLSDYSLETVQMFERDARLSNFKI
ncbi:MipB Transaldolase [Candidatus Nanopelagicaceae bacterium]